MTRIDFHHNAPDRLAAACQLAGELYRQGRQVCIFAPDPAVLERIDRLLWTQPATGFVPHCAAGSALAPETPVLLCRDIESTGQDDVLVNLDSAPPASFARFQQLIEVVGMDETDRQPARDRYRFYKERGYPLSAREFGAGSGA